VVYYNGRQRKKLRFADMGEVTKQNHLRVVTALFRFAIRRKCLRKGALEEDEPVQQAKEDSGEIEIFSPAKMNEILTCSPR
jgi:hypothetical protein